MSDVLALQSILPIIIFQPTSRYAGLEIAKIEINGEWVSYVRRRFVPQPEVFAPIAEHTVVAGERLDHIAARYLGDPEAFWRICDANRAVRPQDLTDTIGRTIVITLPEGVPGVF